LNYQFFVVVVVVV